MSPLHLFAYPDTATEPVDFHDFLRGKTFEDQPTEEEIVTLNERRARVRHLLSSSPNTTALLEAIESYVPKLASLLVFVENREFQKKVMAEFKWYPSLSASQRINLSGDSRKATVKNYSIYYEIIYVHMAYAFALTNMAISKASLDCSNEDLNVAIEYLCQASSLFLHMSTSYASTWTDRNGPPETTVESLAALSELALADAQQLACLRAERMKLSFGTQIKLVSGVVVKYQKCLATLKKNGSDYEKLSKTLRSHLEHGGKHLEGAMLLRIAKDAAGKSEFGRAVAAITGAHNMFVDCLKAEDARIKATAKTILTETDALHASYTKMNNNFSYQSVPNLEAFMNEYRANCRIVVAAKPAFLK